MVFAFGGCKSQQVSNNKMNAVKILADFPTMSERGEILRVRDSLYIIYYKDYIIYKIGVPRSKDIQWVNEEGDVIKRMELRNWYDYRYYVRKRNEQKGYYFDSLSAPQYKMMNVDSLARKKITIKQAAIYTESDSLIASFTGDDGKLSETYIRKRTDNPLVADTMFFVYDAKVTGIDFSLHSYLDSIKKKKLVSVRTVNPPDPVREHPFFNTRRENHISMELVKVAEEKELLELISRVKEY